MPDVPYCRQLEDKQVYLEHLFARFAAQELPAIIPSPQLRAYRNKMEYAVGGSSDEPCIGLRRRKQHRGLVDVRRCPVFFPADAALLDVFREWMRSCRVEPYDVYKHTGELRYVTLRHAKACDEMMVVIVMAQAPERIREDMHEAKYRWLLERLRLFPQVRSVYLCANAAWSDTALTN